LFADDTVVLGPGWDGVQAHPAGPFMNLPAESEPPAGEDLGLLAGERWIAVAGAARYPARVAAIVVLERGPGKLLGAWPLSGTPLTLAPFALGLPDDTGRDASRFELYADLIEEAKLLRLTADLGHSPADLAEILEGTLGLAPLVGETA
jgi:pimeloyl-ACP methyl ester carboxylesterase